MATLASKMKQKRKVRGPGGQLMNVTGETLQGAAQRVGMAAPPITAEGARGLGTSADVQKMAGTPQQKQAAFDLSAQATLQDARRTQQDRTQATAQEQAQREKSEQLSQLGGMGDRIQSMLDSEIANMTAQQQQLQVAEDLSAVQMAEGYTEQDLRSALDKFISGAPVLEGEEDPLISINKALGKEPGAPLTVEELQSLFGDIDEQTAQAIANAAPDDILVDEALAQDLGFNNLDELADLLGMTGEDLAAMNVNQMDERVQALQAEEFNQLEALRARAQDPNISDAERAAIGQQMRALGASGVRATEDQVADLAGELAKAEVVEIAGEQMTIEEALSDEYISGLVKDYLLNPESAAADALPDEFKSFIETHRDALEDAADELDEDVTEFAELQKENLEIGTIETDDGKMLPEIAGSVLENLFGEGWKDQFRTERIDTSKWPGFQLLQGDSLTDTEKASMVAGMNELADYNPELASQLMQLSEKDLDRMGVLSNSKDWRMYRNQLKLAKDMGRTNPRDLDAVLTKYLGETNLKDFKNAWDQAGLRKELGFGNHDLFNQFDSTFGGKKINPAALHARVMSVNEVSDIRNYKKSLVPRVNGNALTKKLNAANNEDLTWETVRPYLFDKKMSKQEAADAFAALNERSGFDAVADLYHHMKKNGKVKGWGNLGKRINEHLDYWADEQLDRAAANSGFDFGKLQRYVDKVAQHRPQDRQLDIKGKRIKIDKRAEKGAQNDIINHFRKYGADLRNAFQALRVDQQGSEREKRAIYKRARQRLFDMYGPYVSHRELLDVLPKF